jgi:hypothetical protein
MTKIRLTDAPSLDYEDQGQKLVVKNAFTVDGEAYDIVVEKDGLDLRGGTLPDLARRIQSVWEQSVSKSPSPEHMAFKWDPNKGVAQVSTDRTNFTPTTNVAPMMKLHRDVAETKSFEIPSTVPVATSSGSLPKSSSVPIPVPTQVVAVTKPAPTSVPVPVTVLVATPPVIQPVDSSSSSVPIPVPAQVAVVEEDIDIEIDNGFFLPSNPSSRSQIPKIPLPSQAEIDRVFNQVLAEQLSIGKDPISFLDALIEIKNGQIKSTNQFILFLRKYEKAMRFSVPNHQDHAKMLVVKDFISRYPKMIADAGFKNPVSDILDNIQ